MSKIPLAIILVKLEILFLIGIICNGFFLEIKLTIDFFFQNSLGTKMFCNHPLFFKKKFTSFTRKGGHLFRILRFITKHCNIRERLNSHVIRRVSLITLVRSIGSIYVSSNYRI